MQAGKYPLSMLATLVIGGLLLTGCERERQSIEAPTDEAGLTIAPEKGMYDDLNITTAVSTALRSEQRLNNLNIQVETDKGDVRLHGEVATEEQRQLAESIARGTPGVHAVNNDLEVK
ncbi:MULTISPECIES: BON domain-containing protein [unclassified Arsukibacterium]|uniref:BON domain-containing protein n=1 Tax=unclassified Arsukibacterium TaxID=2635278 RepID=UPI000C4AFDD9|nr:MULTISPECIES: BON domain-containing protein [unclassified Arsukibacterium]MBM33289.1 transporter [Rheinheimera sp.]HAW94158.1 transporter [Candidatus Azambacteria bacterium]